MQLEPASTETTALNVPWTTYKIKFVFHSENPLVNPAVVLIHGISVLVVETFQMQKVVNLGNTACLQVHKFSGSSLQGFTV